MPKSKGVKYIFVTGGVVSSLGKGILSSSLGALLKARGLRVTIQKYDPYINVDPGTMSPFQHGEVYVTDDGAEADLDLGHYERFLDIATDRQNSMTMGRIYQTVLERERRGDYLGATVQVVPHVIDQIKHEILHHSATGKYDVVITEIGGTVGDIESLPLLEAMRQLKLHLGPKNFVAIHLTLVPYIKSASELKTKPTQHSVKLLQEIGVQPDILVCRSERELSKEIKHKIGLFCNLSDEDVVGLRDAETIYEVPLVLSQEHLDTLVLKKLGIKISKDAALAEWEAFAHKVKFPRDGTLRIAICGKYTAYPDAYKSIIEAFVHAGAANDVKVLIKWIRSEDIEDKVMTPAEALRDVWGVLVAPGFGQRGIEGKIEIIRFARENNIPFFGICLGMQCAVIEFARNVCGMDNANSTEFQKKTKFPVIDMMEHQKKVKEKGGTMRLGSYPCVLEDGTKAAAAYRRPLINERHRHRFEVNNPYRDELKSHGIVFSGTSPDGELVEIIELPKHRWFLGVQFHPELKSRVHNVHPLFEAFVREAKNFREEQNNLFGSMRSSSKSPEALSHSELKSPEREAEAMKV
ncbi:MAG: CTP synthase [Chloroherpetonaceae bacterium]|nr:CTP synthase [Chloroherpetonaceae bacterium]